MGDYRERMDGWMTPCELSVVAADSMAPTKINSGEKEFFLCRMYSMSDEMSRLISDMTFRNK